MAEVVINIIGRLLLALPLWAEMHGSRACNAEVGDRTIGVMEGSEFLWYLTGRPPYLAKILLIICNPSAPRAS